MSEIAAPTVHEEYAFACMRCGHGWEQAYAIEHHVDGSGNAFVVYKADGRRVPSPLSTPTCENCGGHVVRIMRAGRVSTVQRLLQPPQTALPDEPGDGTPGEEMAVAAVRAPGAEEHHWHLSDLLRPFHRR
ncbi:hypothetical protein ABZ172_05425 [Streptomyces sp. NPDC006296]|uniref:hypothetical protein n=1 Tax=Streptomyces sp. NPDC006296 TaxID=3156746 RepID=UPI0033ABB06B